MSAVADPLKILIGGSSDENDAVPDADFVSFVVDRDMYQPDMATVVLSNQNDIYGGKYNIGDSIEIKAGKDLASIYKGEIVGFEGHYKGKDSTRLTIRAMNKMHRLLRVRKSLTFAGKTDKDIITAVAQGAGLTVDWAPAASIEYKHVYQHNLTDLEFIRTRAARLGRHVWCVDTKLHVKEPPLGEKSDIKLSVDETGELTGFMPRISSASVVKKVTVKGWNPETKELIIGTASASGSKLGKKSAVDACGPLAAEETFVVDHPIWSKEEADAIAKARLCDLNLTYITGEAELKGNPKIELGKTIEIKANANGEDPFNGDYYVMGVTHRYTLPKSSQGGFVSIIKFARDAQG